jgi:hypothetical protein
LDTQDMLSKSSGRQIPGSLIILANQSGHRVRKPLWL